LSVGPGVEVVSPNDLVYVVEEKVEEYLSVGVRLVWVINPNVRTVRVYRLDRSFAGLRESDTLSGEQVIPGFECRVQDLFPPRPALMPTPVTRAEG
jgi:Uma2 family endonuclease